jgi:uncharacterized protein YfaS (alpha-2-macroglobulin family)
LIFVRAGNEFAYHALDDALPAYAYGATYSDTLAEDRTLGLVFTERGIYRPGDTVKLKGIARQEVPRGTLTPAACPIDLLVRGPEGETITETKTTLSAFGTFALDVKIPETGKIGSYSIAVDAHPSTEPAGDAGAGEHGKRKTKAGAPAETTAPGCIIPARRPREPLPEEDDEEDEATSRRAEPDFTGSFEVAEYRPAEFKVAVQATPTLGTPASPAYVRGDEASFSAEANYLFGAPMAGADVRYTITDSPAYFSPPMPDGFVASDEPFYADRPEASPSAHELASGNDKLDDKGGVSAKTKLAWGDAAGPRRVTCETEVTDLSRQALSGSATALVHPGEFYVAIKPKFDFFLPAKDPAKIDVLTVAPDGKVRPSVDVKVELVLRKWTHATEATENGGVHYVSSVVDSTVGACTVKTGESPAPCSLSPIEPGYYIVHATAKDARDNGIGASSSFYVLGPGESAWPEHDEPKIDLVADRTTYQVGQTAHILVKSPFKSAQALVTVERAAIHEKRRMTIEGATPTIDIPVTEEDRPNVYVSVVLLRGRTRPLPEDPKQPDVGAPAFRAGYATLTVDPESRRLKVALKPNRPTFLPGEEASVDIDVRDGHGKGMRSEVTLYAADEGVLSLIGYKTPDPIPVFTAPRPLSVATLEARTSMATMHILQGGDDASIDKGLEGGGGGEGMTVRRDFRQTVYFDPSLVTDGSGHAHASFKLPEGLSTYRIMAVAVAEDDRFGSSETSVVTSKPLMARPAFPRIVRAGDKLDAGLIVTSKGLGKTEVHVEASAEGLTLASDAKRSVVLGPDESSEVRFLWHADQAGKAKVKFTVRGGDASDAVEFERDVLVPMSPEAAALYGDTTTAAGEKLGDVGAIRDDVGGLHVSLASTALTGLGGGVDQLVEYPYGCTEQLTSRLVPLLPLRDLANDFHLSLPADIDRVVPKTVAAILANQKEDGGFGLFPDSPRSMPWVSIYAVWGLHHAKVHGVAVPDDDYDRAVAYIRNLLSWTEAWFGPTLAAFAADVLAEVGEPDPGGMTRLFEKRDKLPLFGKALLAHAMAISHADPASVATLVQELEQHVRLDGPLARIAADENDAYAPLMDSEGRTTALVLRALLAARPDHPMASRIAMGLLDQRKNGTWRSTQETAWALIALDEYRKAQEREPPSFDAHAFLGSAELLTAAFHSRTTAGFQTMIPARDLIKAGGQILAFEVNGTGRLFYEARLRYARKELPKDAIDRGFFVTKSLRAVRPQDLEEAVKKVPRGGESLGANGATFHGGDLVLADLVVVVPSPRQFVVVDDPIPAGLEAVDSTLVTTAPSLAIEATGGAREDLEQAQTEDEAENALAAGRAYLSSSVRRELHDDRALFFVEHLAQGMYHYRYLARATTFGTFVLPPTHAEEMYAPEVFGRTVSSTITIAPAESAP